MTTILAIETSCDETAAAVVQDGTRVLSSVIASQIPLHARYGGVIPEIAARAHTESILPIITQALQNAFGNNEPTALIKNNIDYIAVTHGPGLVGSLLIGVTTAQSLSLALQKPLIPVHHILGHLYSPFLLSSDRSVISNVTFEISHSRQYPFPFLTLTASGSHTELILSTSHSDHRIISQTRDDAAGEAFDKAARLLGLPYPGGPEIARLAEFGNPKAYTLPRGMAKDASLDFSFSGVKTAFKELVKNLESKGSIEPLKADLSASFEASIIDSLVQKSISCAKQHSIKQLNLTGGVAANKHLRAALKSATSALDIPFGTPDFAYCTDNAAMIAAAAHASVLASSLHGNVIAAAAHASVLASSLHGNVIGAAAHASIQASVLRSNAIGAAAQASTLISAKFPWYDVKVERQPLLSLNTN